MPQASVCVQASPLWCYLTTELRTRQDRYCTKRAGAPRAATHKKNSARRHRRRAWYTARGKHRLRHCRPHQPQHTHTCPKTLSSSTPPCSLLLPPVILQPVELRLLHMQPLLPSPSRRMALHMLRPLPAQRPRCTALLSTLCPLRPPIAGCTRATSLVKGAGVRLSRSGLDLSISGQGRVGCVRRAAVVHHKLQSTNSSHGADRPDYWQQHFLVAPPSAFDPPPPS